MYWFNLPSIIVKKIKDIEFMHVKLHRKTNKYDIYYEIKYIMHLNNSPYRSNDNKYAMFVKWNDGSNYILLIGQNPAECQTIKKQQFHTDNTNWNIIKTLKSLGYDGYIMINTFSSINSKGNLVTFINNQNKNLDVFNCILKTLKIKNIYLACTQTNFVALDFVKNLQSKKNLNYYKFMCKDRTISHFSQQFFARNLSACNLNNVNITFAQLSIVSASVDSKNNICKVGF